jgi:hypothetical protein
MNTSGNALEYDRGHLKLLFPCTADQLLRVLAKVTKHPPKLWGLCRGVGEVTA